MIFAQQRAEIVEFFRKRLNIEAQPNMIQRVRGFSWICLGWQVQEWPTFQEDGGCERAMQR